MKKLRKFEACLVDGDYKAKAGGELMRADGAGDELLRRCILRLCARRGGSPVAPEFGSRLWLVAREKPPARAAAALRYAAEALADEAVRVVGVEVAEGEDALMAFKFELELEDGSEVELEVAV